MRLAVMQPYLFPYLGYYQLAHAVDTFVFFDDVNYINKGWINRNRILQQKEPFRFTMPLIKASQNRLINEIEIAEFDKWRKDFLKLLEQNYKKAPCYAFVSNWLQEFLYAKDYRLISEIAADSVRNIAGLLELTTDFKFSSELDYKTGEFQKGQDKVLCICRILEADQYINPQNGVDIYDHQAFEDNGFDLKFIHMGEVIYDQFEDTPFVSALSILDVMMFNDINKMKELITQYTLTKKTDYYGVG
jgi:hypothetical protein